jgi:hypothetical protein
MTYGHLARDAEDQDRDLLDAYDMGASSASGHVVGTGSGENELTGEPESEETP